jgi:alpha-tubulin suppressor-like RCC1 family protein
MLGSNKHLQLGLEEQTVDTPTLLPLKQSAENSLFVIDISAGYRHSMFVAATCTGTQVWGCGTNVNNQISNDSGQTLAPTHVSYYNDDNITKIRCGYHSTILINDKGRVFIRGKGVPTDQDLLVLENEVITEAVGGNGYHLFISQEGKCFVHGKNDMSQLGVMGDVSVETIRVLAPMVDRRVILGDAAYDHTVLVTEDGELFTTGKTTHGSLGRTIGKELSSKGIGKVTKNVEGKRVRTASAGGAHTAISTWDGEAMVCGIPSYGRLGIRTGTKEPGIMGVVDKSKWEIERQPIYIIQACATGWGTFLVENSSKETIEFENMPTFKPK